MNRGTGGAVPGQVRQIVGDPLSLQRIEIPLHGVPSQGVETVRFRLQYRPEPAVLPEPRDPVAAVSGHEGRYALGRKRGLEFVMVFGRQDPVHMRVHVDESGSDDLAGAVDGFTGEFDLSWRNRFDPAVVDQQVSLVGVFAGPVYDEAVFQEQA